MAGAPRSSESHAAVSAGRMLTESKVAAQTLPPLLCALTASPAYTGPVMSMVWVLCKVQATPSAER